MFVFNGQPLLAPMHLESRNLALNFVKITVVVNHCVFGCMKQLCFHHFNLTLDLVMLFFDLSPPLSLVELERMDMVECLDHQSDQASLGDLISLHLLAWA